MFQYKVLVAQKIYDLELEVKEYCQEGWRPQGGISYGPYGKGWFDKRHNFYQAITKEATTPNRVSPTLRSRSS